MIFWRIYASYWPLFRRCYLDLAMYTPHIGSYSADDILILWRIYASYWPYSADNILILWHIHASYWSLFCRWYLDLVTQIRLLLALILQMMPWSCDAYTYPIGHYSADTILILWRIYESYWPLFSRYYLDLVKHIRLLLALILQMLSWSCGAYTPPIGPYSADDILIL